MRSLAFPFRRSYLTIPPRDFLGRLVILFRRRRLFRFFLFFFFLPVDLLPLPLPCGVPILNPHTNKPNRKHNHHKGGHWHRDLPIQYERRFQDPFTPGVVPFEEWDGE